MSGQHLSRRVALGGVAATTAVVVTGCTGSSASSAGSPGPTATRSPRRSQSPDEKLLDTALVDEDHVLQRLTGTVRRHPGLASVLAGTRSVHREHRDLLGRVGPGGTYFAFDDSHGIPAGATAALRAVAGGQAQLADRFRRHAQDARSGAFARVLASMAAASDQQAERLSAAVAARR